MKIIFEPEVVLQGDKFIKNKGVLVENGVIAEISDAERLIEKHKDATIAKWDNLAMVPGTINSHNHSFQSLLRGIATDKPFLTWRDEALYKYSPKLSKEDIYVGALFAFAEMLKYGVTTVCDFFYVHNDGLESDEAVIKAAKDLGIRLVLARCMYDWEGAPKGYQESVEEAVNNVRTLAEKYKNDPMVTISPAPHSLHAASIEMVKAGHQLAKELNTNYHIHVAEEMFEVEETLKNHGLRPVELLREIGVLDESTVMIHAVWLTEEEIKLLGENKVKLAYCPSSNMFLADGITKIPEMLKGGVSIGLGTDGGCSNNRISVFEEMRMAALLQKVGNLDSTIINSNQVFSMGTEQGGKVLGLPIGKIEVGYMADFVGINLKDLSMQPIYSIEESLLPNLVYSMQPNAISKVVVAGKEIVNENKLLSMVEEEILTKIQSLIEKLKWC